MKVLKILYSVAVVVACVWIVGCTASDPVKDWKFCCISDPGTLDGSIPPDCHINQAIVDDYRAYARGVWPKDRDFFIASVMVYEDGTGRHAVRLELEPALREFQEYFLMYGTNNVRVEVIKGKSRHQFHI